MIQDIKPNIFHNEYNPSLPSEDSYILYFKDDCVMVSQVDGIITFPNFNSMQKDFRNKDKNLQYLFAIDEIKYYLASEPIKSVVGYRMEKISLFRKAQPNVLAFAGITAYQLYKWYEEHKFCGKCGSPLTHASKERALICGHCKIQEYPKISPAVIVALVNHDKILMSKYANRAYKRYALLAGFAEIGETIEETVSREVFEEVGLKVKNVRYYKSQPWSFSDSLLLGFFAEVDGDEEITLDTDELSEAGWFTRDEIVIDESKISLTNEMIRLFRDGLY